MILKGVLIAESLRAGGELSGIPLIVVKLSRIEAGSATAGQPGQWTLLDFEAAETDAEELADALAGCLASTGGWYVNYNTSIEAFVVFAGRVFRYPRGDAAGRTKVKEYARSVGVPDTQLDWDD
ncbi:hypothetical protein ACFYWN_42745 [Streptomyces sp. NPDC002917]|uniref:hypothetical protein n=1 Tax=Streptomyces sp. NPDC002917 TaxID=3364671 RepID=UPI0036A6DA68